MLLAVVGVKIHLLYLAHERLTRVRSGALVVKRLLGHIVKAGKEVCLIHAIVAYRLLDTHALLESIDGGNKAFELFGIGPALKTQRVGDFGIAGKCVRVVRRCPS